MKIKFGAIVTDGRGKLGGHVLAKNRSGNYMRTKVTPVNPQTVYQQAARSSLGSLSSSWSGLDQSQRDAWDGAVSDFQKTDIFGDLKTPTGKNLYTGLNRNLLEVGSAIIDTPPAPGTIPSVTINSADYSLIGLSFDVGYTGDATGASVEIWATPPVSAGTSFVKNRLRLTTTAAGAASGTVDLYDAYIDRFGVPAVGSKVYVGVKVINAGGEAGVRSTFLASIAA